MAAELQVRAGPRRLTSVSILLRGLLILAVRAGGDFGESFKEKKILQGKEVEVEGGLSCWGLSY